MPKVKKTKTEFVRHLNECSPDFTSDRWIIGGIFRHNYAKQRLYGEALRKYDPIAFRVGYNIWLDTLEREASK